MDKYKVRQEIMALEKQFCLDVSREGVEGWLRYLADNVIMCTSKHHEVVRGKDTVRKRLEGLYKAEKVLYHWDVEYVDVSNDCSIAYSYSLYTFKYVVKGEKRAYIGKDCNIWKRINGEYKVVMQIGNRNEVNPAELTKSIGKIR